MAASMAFPKWMVYIGESYEKWWIPKMDGSKNGKCIYKWMIWGYPYFRKPSFVDICFFHLKNKDSLGIDLSQAGQNTRNGSSMFIRYKYGNSTMNTLKYSTHPKWYVVFSSFFPECVAKDSHFTLGVWGSTSLSEHFWTLSC